VPGRWPFVHLANAASDEQGLGAARIESSSFRNRRAGPLPQHRPAASIPEPGPALSAREELLPSGVKSPTIGTKVSFRGCPTSLPVWASHRREIAISVADQDVSAVRAVAPLVKRGTGDRIIAKFAGGAIPDADQTAEGAACHNRHEGPPIRTERDGDDLPSWGSGGPASCRVGDVPDAGVWSSAPVQQLPGVMTKCSE